MLPVIALVGRPNVGKSTLFNRLTQSRDALVADLPGLTRDRQYGIGRLGDFPYVVVDTGGLSGHEEGVDPLMEQQVWQAIDEADHVLFLVDARDGCNAGDESIAEKLRRTGKPVTLVVNKSEGFDPSVAVSEFYGLAGEPVAIAAAHGRGVRQLIDGVLETFPPPEESGEEDESQGIRVAVVGRPNVGKSTLINRLIGEERVVAFDMPGTTRDSIAVPFEQNGHRRKEIGIRRVLGAGVGAIVRLISLDYARLILIAAAIAFPLAWWFMSDWLRDFAYPIELSWWVFALAAVTALAVAWITIGVQSARAALSNPVNSLRSE